MNLLSVGRAAKLSRRATIRTLDCSTSVSSPSRASGLCAAALAQLAALDSTPSRDTRSPERIACFDPKTLYELLGRHLHLGERRSYTLSSLEAPHAAAGRWGGATLLGRLNQLRWRVLPDLARASRRNRDRAGLRSCHATGGGSRSYVLPFEAAVGPPAGFRGICAPTAPRPSADVCPSGVHKQNAIALSL